ncbi:hypothetical protein [Agarilytica rhodophyticola]|uniref:hypothetical protein n=1 Tax=Agarilytica rhodophyticola TaxID=1737490 RepID=UPI000B341C3D|nr:hypothetical protein [Agarilytica rhodophyticola]
MKNPKLIKVKWIDSAQPVPSWSFLEDMPDMEAINCESVGWLVAESDDVIMLAPNIANVGSESAQGSGFMRIPKCAILDTSSLTF